MDRLKRKFGFYIMASIFMLSSAFGFGMMFSNVGLSPTSSSVVEEDDDLSVEDYEDDMISANARKEYTGYNPTISVAAGDTVVVQDAYFNEDITLSNVSADVYFENVIFEMGAKSTQIFAASYSNINIHFTDVYIHQGTLSTTVKSFEKENVYRNSSNTSVGGTFSADGMVSSSTIYDINFLTAQSFEGKEYWSGAWDFESKWGYYIENKESVTAIESTPKPLSWLLEEYNEPSTYWHVMFYDTNSERAIRTIINSNDTDATISNKNIFFTRTGYTHKWAYSNGGEGADEVRITQSGELYTVWEASPYTITYNPNGGTGSEQTQAVTFDANFTTKASNTYTRTGYTFGGWSTSTSSLAGSYTKAGTTYKYTTAGNTTLYAYWQINTYTLTINYHSSSAYTHATNLNISQGSSTVSSGSIARGGSATVKHAYSTNSLTVSFAAAQQSSYDYYINIGSAPTTSSSVDTKTYSWTPTSNATINVYVFERYTVQFNGNGKTGGTVPSTTYKMHGTNLTITANSLTRTGYTANGWNTSATITASPAYTTSYTANASVTLYANWKANPYTITYNSNYGTATTQTQNVIYNAKFTTKASNTFTRTGYAFTGWSTSKTAIVGDYTKASTEYTYTTAGNTILYAIWSPITYKITLDSRYYATSSTATGVNVTSPGTAAIYEKYATGWYSNEGATSSIVKVPTLPTYTGHTFQGY